MEIINYANRLPALFTKKGLFEEEPFTLIDVGCSGGLDIVWDRFGDGLVAHGFDPKIDQVERLNECETRPKVQYHANMIGLAENHPFMIRKTENNRNTSPYFLYFDRSSAMWVNHNVKTSQFFNSGRDARLTTEKKSIAAFVFDVDLPGLDFLKIDTDGGDLEALVSAEPVLRSHEVLGVLIEVPLYGGYHDTENSIHAIDLFLRRQGYLPFSMHFHKYSRPALPGTFVYDIPAQTVNGEAMWGDMLYLRDPGSEYYTDVWPELTPMQGIKMLCLFDIFKLQDCAVELMLKERKMFDGMFSIADVLDLLTPELHGEQLTYEAYVARFHQDHRNFYPLKKKSG